MTAVSAGPDAALVFRPADRLLRLGLAVCGTAVVAGPLLVLTFWLHSTGAAVALVVLHVAATVLCCRMASECCAVGAGGIVDRRTFGTWSCRWQDVAAVGVDSPGGPWGGLCVRLHPRQGPPVPLLGTRCYAYSVASEGLRTLTSAHAEIEERLGRLGRVSRR